MSYDNEIVKICRLVNGYEVEIFDPPKEQPKAKKDMPMSYSPTWKAFAFSTEQEVLKFLKERMGGLRRKSADEEYEESFKAATK